MRRGRLVGVAFLGVLAGCGGGNGGGATEAPAPAAPPSAPAPAPNDAGVTGNAGEAGAPAADDAGAGRADAQAPSEAGSDASSVITVNGLLLGGGAPLPYTALSISGRAPVFTDASGKFQVANVAAPYDLAVSLGSDWFIVLQGLTNPAPVLKMPGSLVQNATLTGLMTSLFGASGPIQNGVLFATPSGSRLDTAQSNGSFGYTNDIVWAGPSQEDVDIYTLEWGNDALGRPSFWTAHGSATVEQGGTTSNVMVNPSPAPTAHITGTVSLPAGYALQEITASWAPEPLTTTGTINFFSDTSGKASFDILAPKVGTIVVSAVATMPPDGAYSGGAASVATAGGSPLTLSVPQAPQLILPVNNTPGVAATDTFSWAPTPGLNLVTFAPSSGRNAPSVYLFTEETSCTFPDLGAFGVAFPPGATYEWSVTVATGVGPDPVDALTSSGPSDDLGLPVGIGSAGSSARTFTTAQ